jgi:hypothetical protein
MTNVTAEPRRFVDGIMPNLISSFVLGFDAVHNI